MRILCAIAVVLLTACSSQPPQTATYLLRSDVPAGEDVALRDSGVALGNIRVANYIDQPGLVMATGDGTIRAAKYHVWAEPLQVALRRYLATQVSDASGRDIEAMATSATVTRIDVSVDQLHGTGSGAAILVAYWNVGPQGVMKSYRFSEQQSLAGDGYDALVRAQEALLKRLAEAISASLPAAGQGSV